MELDWIHLHTHSTTSTVVDKMQSTPEEEAAFKQVRFCHLLDVAVEWIKWYPGKLMIAGGAAVWMKKYNMTPEKIKKIATGEDVPIDCSWLPEDVDVWCSGVAEVPGMRRNEADAVIRHPFDDDELEREPCMPFYDNMQVEEGFYAHLARCHNIKIGSSQIQFLRVPTGWDLETTLAAFDLPVCRVGYTYGYHRDDEPFYQLREIVCRYTDVRYQELRDAVKYGGFMTCLRNMRARIDKYRQRGFVVDIDPMIEADDELALAYFAKRPKTA